MARDALGKLEKLTIDADHGCYFSSFLGYFGFPRYLMHTRCDFGRRVLENSSFRVMVGVKNGGGVTQHSMKQNIGVLYMHFQEHIKAYRCCKPNR